MLASVAGSAEESVTRVSAVAKSVRKCILIGNFPLGESGRGVSSVCLEFCKWVLIIEVM